MQSGLLRAQGMPNAARQKFRKGEQTPRMWSVREEEILAATLLLLKARGWISEKGFRAGYLGIIEDRIRTEFPNSDLKGRTHIKSKILAWQMSYNALRQILGRTGVRFNLDGDYKIDCDDEQWEQIVQADSQAKGMRTKSWPFWVTWQRVFGKDRSSGGGAEGVDVSANRARQQMAGRSQCNENDYRPSVPVDQTPPMAGEEDIPDNISESTEKQMPSNKSGGGKLLTAPLAGEEDIPDNVSENTEKQMPSNKSGGGKRKQPPSDDPLMEFLANLHAETNARLEVFVARIGYEFDMGKARHELFNTLGTVDGLTLNQRYELCNILSDKPQRLEVFMGMPANARLGYVLRLLAQK